MRVVFKTINFIVLQNYIRFKLKVQNYIRFNFGQFFQNYIRLRRGAKLYSFAGGAKLNYIHFRNCRKIFFGEQSERSELDIIKVFITSEASPEL